MDSQGRNVIVCDNGTGVSICLEITQKLSNFYWVGFEKKISYLGNFF